MDKTLSQIYALRRDFVIIGLTGRTGSGCSTVANILAEKFENIKTNFRVKNNDKISNETRKDAIIYNFLSQDNWIPFDIITASDVIYLFALQNDFKEFKELLTKNVSVEDRKLEIDRVLDNIKEPYNELHGKSRALLDCLKNKTYQDNKTTKEVLESNWKILTHLIPKFRNDLNFELNKIDKKILTSELQNWGNNIRKYGSVNPDKPDNEIQKQSPACLAWVINRLAKMIRRMHEFDQKPTRIVIDALRNPFEILYFRERFSAFYTISVTTKHKTRYEKLSEKGISHKEAIKIDEAEKAKKDFSSSYQQIDVDRCIELSDIFLTHDGTPADQNRDLKNQIARYIALILHPGLVPPSPMERVMQIANTAKLNSGCLSRQVGAAVTDKYFSVKAIGWNTVAEGQTPCSLRNLYDLINKEDDDAYSEFEKNDEKFRLFAKGLKLAYDSKDNNGDMDDKKALKALGRPYCFKDLYTTSYSKHRGNQVHTRSLHAEENAFLQLAKYGSQGIKDGLLFTTASCCELCGKKAYQLGVRKIYYIDTYPGITEDHILKCGTNSPDMELFHGAIGSAYIALYEPFLPLKDEIKELSGIDPKSPLDYLRGEKDKQPTELLIKVVCQNPAELHDRFIEDIDSGKISSWEIDTEGHITTALDDKRRMCWFEMTYDDHAVKFNLIGSSQFKCDDKLKAIYYGRLITTLFANFRSFKFEIDNSAYFTD